MTCCDAFDKCSVRKRMVQWGMDCHIRKLNAPGRCGGCPYKRQLRSFLKHFATFFPTVLSILLHQNYLGRCFLIYAAMLRYSVWFQDWSPNWVQRILHIYNASNNIIAPKLRVHACSCSTMSQKMVRTTPSNLHQTISNHNLPMDTEVRQDSGETLGARPSPTSTV